MQRNKIQKRTNRRVSSKVLIIASALLFAIICTGMGYSRLTSLPSAVVTGGNASKALSGPQQGGRDEVRIKLTSDGFMPTEVTHLAGTFAIAVENTSPREEYTLRFKAEDGTVLNEVMVQKGSTAWSVTLQPGRYTLTEANHQQWICNISVQ